MIQVARDLIVKSLQTTETKDRIPDFSQLDKSGTSTANAELKNKIPDFNISGDVDSSKGRASLQSLIPDFSKLREEKVKIDNFEQINETFTAKWIEEDRDGKEWIAQDAKNYGKQAEAEKIDNNGNKELTEEEKQQIKNETGWSNEIIDAISSMKEYEIYKNAGLQEAEINGRKCLIRNDIDWDQKDSMGRTNKERAEVGLSPINKDGNTIELHHIGQKSDGPLAELTLDEHRGNENYTVLHDPEKPSEIDRSAFNRERSDHWKARAEAGGQNA